ncbi:dynamin family protein [Dactylosporangium darangshiense]|uniref:dynamin family protein n=1 Tax=Dactylosporangium darangshiense TaxID=579108 RepID=UPI00363414F0
MAPGPLSSRVADLCAEVGNRLGGAAQAQVIDVRRRLGEPLRVAIAGRLKSGKSTLVNALIGRRVAPTEVGECTRIVTQFRYGTSDRVDVVKRNGARVSLPLDEAGMIPQRLGVARHEVAYVDVTLTSDHLRDLTVVDTPGLSSANTSVSDQARRFLFSEAPIDDDLDSDSAGALSGAEAIIYVFTQSVREDDVQALEAFRSISARLSSNPINSSACSTRSTSSPAAGRTRGRSSRRWPTTSRRCCAGSSPTSCLWWGCSPRRPRRAGSPPPTARRCASSPHCRRVSGPCCWPPSTCSPAASAR